ncbi:SPOR domain-containing protein [Tepidimonas charontis]|uniref:Cell division protein FtsN n=1 Tax=Tepidimonas charontis TaxID=2267262 RepID=A0A554XIK6_9BURK|nr:SPOR domain-containing protein [Tepidimonas charontis]TSE35638.1 Cell division protein FtsN [Tepidimonas charontis]
MIAPAPPRWSLPHRQHGSTWLGFLLGLVVGIGLSLAVAVYVTKVPIPLVDRGVQRKPAQADTEAQRLQQWNPNAGLSSARPAAPAASSADNAEGERTEPAPDPIAELIQQRVGGGPAAAPAPSAAPAPAQPSVPTPSAAPAAPAKPAVPSSAGETVDPFHYFVQVGAFRNADEAEAQRARLALQGFDARVSEREQSGQRVWRVRLGPFDSKVQAELMQERLRGAQFETALVRVPR